MPMGEGGRDDAWSSAFDEPEGTPTLFRGKGRTWEAKKSVEELQSVASFIDKDGDGIIKAEELSKLKIFHRFPQASQKLIVDFHEKYGAKSLLYTLTESDFSEFQLQALMHSKHSSSAPPSSPFPLSRHIPLSVLCSFAEQNRA